MIVSSQKIYGEEYGEENQKSKRAENHCRSVIVA